MYLNCLHWKKSLLFRINKSSLGMARIDEAIPWDDCPFAKNNANTFIRARAYRVFPLSVECGGINREGTPRVPKALRGAPEFDPDTRGWKTL